MISVNNPLLKVSISDYEINLALNSGITPEISVRESIVNRILNIIVINDIFKVSMTKNDALVTNANGGVVLYISLEDYSIRDMCFTEISKITSLMGVRPKQLCLLQSQYTRMRN